jgi:pimeloyl-ACP methyl ester carboxylesterase
VKTPASHRVRVGGLELRYLDFGGDGPPLVFLHATGFHAALWEPYARRLTDRFHVLAPDQRGHGESDKPATGYRWEAFGRDFAGFLDVLDLRGVRAVGHSKGATAIAAAAAAGTTRLASAVLIEPVLIAGPPAAQPAHDSPMAVGARRRRAIWPSRDAMFAGLRGKMPFETWEEEFVRLYVDHGVADRADGQVELLCPGTIEAQVYAEAAMTDGFALLPHVRVPTLVVRGARSYGLAGSDVDEVMRRLSAGSLVTIPDAGHFVPMERSRAVADALARFLDAGRS